VQETIRIVADASQYSFEASDGLSIKDVTIQAYEILGESGIIRSAENHFCSECTHTYKRTADILSGEDPAAVVGVDENRDVPAMTDPVNAGMAAQDAAQARLDAQNSRHNRETAENVSDQNAAPVKMVVMDGVVMGPTHCAWDGCTDDLADGKQGVFCTAHTLARQNLCHVRNCNRPKVGNTRACQIHKEQWYSHAVRYGHQSLLGIRRLLRRTEEERLQWLPSRNQQSQAHDSLSANPAPERKHYFSAGRWYCVETICLPCGLVIAWTKFESRPNYVCIDKACLVLRTAISNGSWETWKQTTRFIVDSYHYINHRVLDYICRKWCNPAPLNGSAPNLTIVEYDNQGHPHFKRAFNTQACEQLNAWLGGFQYILNRMTSGNFNWLLHSLLFLHTLRVIKNQEDKKKKKKNENENEEEDLGIDIDQID
jgi:hypothetical protein